MKLLHIICDCTTGHGVHNIMIYNNVSHNFQFLLCFLYITHFVEIYKKKFIIKPVDINFNKQEWYFEN